MISELVETSNSFSLLEDECENDQDVSNNSDPFSNVINCLKNKTNVKPIIPATFKKTKFNILLDTGSPVNIMDDVTYNYLFSELPLENAHADLVDINSNQIKVIGRISLPYCIKSYNFTDEFYVIKNLKSHPIILLGYPSCGKNKIRLLPDKNGVLINKMVFVGHSVSEDNKNKENVQNGESVDPVQFLLKDNKVHAVIKSKAISLVPGETQSIKVKVAKSKSDGNLLILPETVQVKGISTESGLYNTINNVFYLNIHNQRNSVVHLNKHSAICKAEKYSHEIIEMDENENRNETVYHVEDSDVTERINLYKENANSSDFDEAKVPMFNLLKEFPDVIAIPGDRLGCTDKLKHKINLEKKTGIIYIPSYRIPVKHKSYVDEAVKDMLSEGVIRESDSPYNFPLICVPKKDGSWRIVIDYRKLNSSTIPDRYPAHNLRDIMAEIGQNKYFSSLDLLQGFLQVPLEESSRKLTAFSTPSGHWEYVRMPFGLKQSPITFTRLVNSVFKGLLGNGVHVYMDDILVCSKTLQEHLEKLRQIFLRLRDANLKVKLKKCSFVRKELIYLGHVISENGLQVNDKKIESIKDYPVPKNRKNVLQFLGVTGFYRNFIHSYSHIAYPLTSLLKKDVKFTWGNDQQTAFQKLKNALLKPPILQMPDFSNKFYVVTDASGYGIGGVLMQLVKNKLHPIAFYSRKLKDRELTLSVTNKESLAIIDTLKHFKYIISGTDIVVLTDHKPVLEIFKYPDYSVYRSRLFITISDFNPSFKYISGKSNIIADALSRNVPIDSDVTPNQVAVCREGIIDRENILDWSVDKVIREQENDPMLGEVKRYVLGEIESLKIKFPTENVKIVNNVLVRETKIKTRSVFNDVYQVLLPSSLVSAALEIFHDRKSHSGVCKMIKEMRRQFFWRGMDKDIKRYIKQCVSCARHKGDVIKNQALVSYPTPDYPFQRVHMDLLTNFNESLRGNRHVMVIIDALTRFTEIIPLSGKTGVECATEFFRKFVCHYGIPQIIITDSGTEFNNKFYRKMSDLYKIKLIRIAVRNPSSNGLVERTNRKILNALRFSIGENDPNWDLHLEAAQSAINHSIHNTIEIDPHTALYGWRAKSPFDIIIDDNVHESDVDVHISNAENRFKMLKNKLIESEIILRKRYENRGKVVNLDIGDKVFLKNQIRKGLNYKLAPIFDGPFTVIERIHSKKYKLKDGNGEEVTAHINNLKLYKVNNRSKKKVKFSKNIVYI